MTACFYPAVIRDGFIQFSDDIFLYPVFFAKCIQGSVFSDNNFHAAILGGRDPVFIRNHGKRIVLIRMYAQGQHNDGLDANGNLYIKGGLVYAICSGTPEVAIDANTEEGKKLYITGGTIVAIGGLESGSSLSQSCYYQSSWSKDTWYTLTYDSNTFSFQTPSSGGSGLVVSAASTPTLASGTSVSGGTSIFGGIGVMGGTVSGGSSVSLSSYSSGSGGFSPGGWR